MEKVINIVVAVVVIAVFSYMGYIFYQDNLRLKDLDKKRSDNLDREKDLLELAKKKMEEEGIKIVIESKNTPRLRRPSSNGHKKGKTVDLQKEKAN